MTANSIVGEGFQLDQVVTALRIREDQSRADLTLKLHSDGSGRVQASATDEDVFVFDHFSQLAQWLRIPAPIHAFPDPGEDKKPPGRFHVSNACLGNFHRQCIQGLARPCHCRCHQKTGGDAA